MGGYYANGRIPFSELVQVGVNHWLLPATAARWAAMRADVLANEGVLLQITPGYNAYRPIEQQVLEKQKACARGRCQDAADPGLSSHGGLFRKTITMAIDVTNWGLIGKAKFYAYARKHGFEPGFFDWEPWHLIDWAPFAMPASGGESAPVITDLLPLRRRREEDGMYLKAASYADVYKIDTVWSDEYPMGQVRMRLCGSSEASFANTGGLTVEGYDSVLRQLATDAAYGLPLPSSARRDDLEVVVIIDSGARTYGLWGPGFWDDTEGLSDADEVEIANSWARLYGNAKNITYAEWADRKRVGTGGKS